MKYDNIADGIVGLINVMVLDYSRLYSTDNPLRESYIEEYVKTIQIVPGTKYCKISTQRGVHSFIVMDDLFANKKKWIKGDILKAASWQSPALNYRRGNVLEGTFSSVRWTGME